MRGMVGQGDWGTGGTTRLFVAMAVLSLCPPVPLSHAQQRSETAPETFSLSGILSAPFPSDLIAAPNGRAVAWIGYEQGRRNIWVAEMPGWHARRLTRWMADDGQDLSELMWTADSRALLVVRGGEPGGNHDEHDPVNPTSDPRGTEQAIWLAALRGAAPRRIGAGFNPVPSPRGDRVVWILRDTLRTAPLARAAAPQILLQERGAIDAPVFSPDARQLAFVSRRGDHAFIGIYDFAARSVVWVSPGTFRDDVPRWSTDGRQLAFIRRQGLPYGTGLPLPPVQAADYAPFAIRIADVRTLESRELWRSPNNADGGFFDAGAWTLQWAAGNRLVFASEQTGWVGLYAMSADGGETTRLTPAGCEIYDVILTADRQSALYTSNCGDLDRRHVQVVDVVGGPPRDITSGSGLEWHPQPLADSLVAIVRSDARQPAAPALAGPPVAVLEGWPVLDSFPSSQLVEPVQAVVRTADSMDIHLQVFVAENGTGERHPALIFLHGGPQRQMLLGWHDRGYYSRAYAFNQFMASRGFVVVSVNYRGGIGYGRAFREAPRRGRFGASEYEDVMAALTWLHARSDVDTTRIGLWGGSYGGYLTALGLARNSDLFAAGFDLHGVHDYAEENEATRRFGVSDSAIAGMRRASPIGDVQRWRSPVLLVQGDDDRNVQFAQTVDLAVRLRRMGVKVEEIVFPDDVHSFLRHVNWVRAYRAGAGFLAEKLR